ncbi:unnamed protein product [Durusdinium trenchii]|uniref:Uncharacterized protein n=1 Tax=Durusdinium trenchii TaxID=1381693 RepID=A0ABP0KKU7_9DINO
MTMEQDAMALLKEIGRVKIELNSMAEGADQRSELEAKLERLTAEHLAATKGPPSRRDMSEPNSTVGSSPAEGSPADTAAPIESAKAKEPDKPERRERIGARSGPPKAAAKTPELERWLQKQRRKASDEGLNFSGGGAVSTADAGAGPGADGYEGIIFQSEGAWSLHQREGRYRFDQGKLRDVETGELLGRFVCERIQEAALEMDPDSFSKLTAENLPILSSEIMTEIQKSENEGALFALPSQLNGAEYPSDSSIKRLVVDYKYDNTGGPRGQLACHPAAAQFVLDNAANLERDGGINAVDLLLENVQGLELVNGYLKIQDCDSDFVVAQLKQHLQHLRPLVMEDVPARGLMPNKRDFSTCEHRVGLVYASAVPLDAYLNAHRSGGSVALDGGAPSAGSPPSSSARGAVVLCAALARLEHQRKVAELILVAQYFGALRYSVM